MEEKMKENEKLLKQMGYQRISPMAWSRDLLYSAPDGIYVTYIMRVHAYTSIQTVRLEIDIRNEHSDDWFPAGTYDVPWERLALMEEKIIDDFSDAMNLTLIS